MPGGSDPRGAPPEFNATPAPNSHPFAEPRFWNDSLSGVRSSYNLYSTPGWRFL